MTTTVGRDVPKGDTGRPISQYASSPPYLVTPLLGMKRQLVVKLEVEVVSISFLTIVGALLATAVQQVAAPLAGSTGLDVKIL